MTAEFDRYANRYEELVERSISFSGKDQAFFLQARARHLVDLVGRRLGDPATIRALDVGCGGGLGHPHLGELGRLEGIDLSKEMIQAARGRNPEVMYHVGDGTRLPFEGGTFDLTFTACVLHHVPPAERGAFSAELARVTRLGGLVVLFEHNPLNPLTRLAVSRCEFDEGAILLGGREARRRLAEAGLRIEESRYILFFPWQGSLFAKAEKALARVSVGAQYYVAARVT